MTLVSQASHTCGTELNFSDIEELLGQKSGCGNYIGRGSAIVLLGTFPGNIFIYPLSFLWVLSVSAIKIVNVPRICRL